MLTTQAPDLPVNAITDFSANYTDKALETAAKASESFQLDKYAQEIGLGDVFKQMNKDRAKIILAALGAFYAMTLIKRNFLKVAVVGGVAILALKNKEKLSTLFNKEKFLQAAIPVEHTEAVAQRVIVDSNAQTIASVRPEEIASEEVLKELDYPTKAEIALA